MQFLKFPVTPSAAPSTDYEVANKKYVNDSVSSAGGGDMMKATYDPNNKSADAFNADNHVSGTTNKVYTATEQTKLSGIDEGAEVNVNADWDATSGDAQILNKPTIDKDYYWVASYPATTASSRTEDSFGNEIIAIADLKIKGAYVKSDWVDSRSYTFKIWSDTSTVAASKSLTGDGTTGTWKTITLDTPFSPTILTSYYITIEDDTNATIKKYYNNSVTYPVPAFVQSLAQFSGTPSSQNASGNPYSLGLILEV